jgi:Icc-related predicted phosphoesterase
MSREAASPNDSRSPRASSLHDHPATQHERAAGEKRAPVRIAAISDIHCGVGGQGSFQELFSEINENADILVISGDLTDYGLPEEAKILARELTNAIRIPTVGVLGNHDFESGKQEEICTILGDAGVKILDGESHEILGIGFAGVKGFAGGFGRGALGPWGEKIIKEFVHEAVNEALKLETALARLRGSQRMAILHYSPIAATVAGEPPEIFPYLGSSRLEEPLSRYPVAVVVHGHAHHGSPEGTTAGGTPVYNVSVQVLKRAYPDRSPYRIIELDATAPEPMS